MESEEDEIKSKQASKKDRTLDFSKSPGSPQEAREGNWFIKKLLT